MSKKESLLIIMFIISILATALILINDLLQGKITHYGYDELYGFIFGLILSISCLILFALYRYNLFDKNAFSKKVYLAEIILILILLASLWGVSDSLYDSFHHETNQEWSIGIYISDSAEPFSFHNDNISNPILTRNDITDVPAGFVADPFLIHKNDTYFLFFEVLNGKNGQGDIGLATSRNYLNWSYKQIILDEPFHLSYPYVFEWKNEYYMIPETNQVKSIRLYKANDFPYNWSLVKTLIDGKNFVDNSIFFYNDTWWILTETFVRNNNNDNLHLYYSDELTGLWTEHPKSPIIMGDANISRPGGNVIVFDNRIVRYAQDCDPYYGNQVWAFEITALTKQTYEEHKVGNRPVIKGFDNWNIHGMHQVSPYMISEGRWIAAVDGY